MRIVGFLLVAAAFLSAACTATTSPDEQCVVQGGMCFITSDVTECGTVVGADLCSSGYSCCGMIDAYNVRDGAVFDAGLPPHLFDASTGDAASDAGTGDARTTEATSDADKTADAAKTTDGSKG